MNGYNLSEKQDSMTNDAVVIDVSITVARYDYSGKRDKRFKSGWRVLPESGINTIINYIIIERDDRYLVSQIWQIGEPNKEDDLGLFMVVFMSPETVKLIPLSLSQNKNKVHFNIKNKLKCIYYGAIYKEN
jgi:hypothetical protein